MLWLLDLTPNHQCDWEHYPDKDPFHFLGICTWTNIPSSHKIPLYLIHMQVKHITSKLLCHCHLSATNKYVPQMPHVPITYVQIWGNYVTIYASYQLTAIIVGDQEHWYTYIPYSGSPYFHNDKIPWYFQGFFSQISWYNFHFT